MREDSQHVRTQKKHDFPGYFKKVCKSRNFNLGSPLIAAHENRSNLIQEGFMNFHDFQTMSSPQRTADTAVLRACQRQSIFEYLWFILAIVRMNCNNSKLFVIQNYLESYDKV